MNVPSSSFAAKLLHEVRSERNPDWVTANSIYVYGTGIAGQEVCQILGERGLTISGYMDHRQREATCIQSIPIFSPDSLTITTRDQVVVILAIHNREVDIPALQIWLQELGYVKFISMIELHDYLGSQLVDRYWLTRRDFYYDYEREIDATARLFADPTSRRVFHSIISFRLTGNYGILPAPDLEHQYFPTDLPSWPNPLRFVDCGAYDGDTLASFLETGYEFQAIAAFEPDLENFRKLTWYVSQNQQRFPYSILFPCGVHSSTTQLTFEIGAGEASRASEKGRTVIQCVSLDESIPSFAPDLIKMDIEGAELDAIHGAKRLIKACRPALAVSVYHTPAHIWEIPICINAIAQEYNIPYTYHLRAHAYNCFDTIFYAIPEKSI
jgi:FkbM family methyltransferase